MRQILIGIATVLAVVGQARATGVDVPAPRFTICGEDRRVNCVVDGDTFWMNGVKIRIADIDAPETHPGRCPYEQQLGEAATFRLQDLLNAGSFDLVSADRDEDQYGRKLRLIMRDDRSIGSELVDEGVARRWDGHRRPWCPE